MLNTNTSIQKKELNLRSNLHLTRKLWHIGCGLTGLFIYHYFHWQPHFAARIFLSMSIIGFTVDFVRLRWPAFNRKVLWLLGPLMRRCEKNAYSGLPFYALGVALSLFFFSEKIAILSILFLVFADPFSSLVGVLYGRDKIWGGKSIQGTLAGFICCYILTLVYGVQFSEPNLSLLLFAFFGGLFGTLSELASIYVNDNLMIPLASGAALTALNLFIPIF